MHRSLHRKVDDFPHFVEKIQENVRFFMIYYMKTDEIFGKKA